MATTWQESPAGPPRRYYELTSQGKEALTRHAGRAHRQDPSATRASAYAGPIGLAP
jgi:DNA-binding PadR family transcriptional regulator